tara:strand:- start:420 stop:641 length:222 start_codon:yes stop_codon:yes gene_type:complete
VPKGGKPYNGNNGPLTNEDKDMLNEAIKAAEDVHDVLLQAELAEIDLGDLPVRLKAAEDQARRIKQAFFQGSA